MKIRKFIIPMLAVFAIAGCQNTTPAIATDDACLIWVPVSFSASGDTAETVAEVRALNARRAAYCGAG